MWQVSERIRQTDVPVMVTNLRLLGGRTDVASLSQGIDCFFRISTCKDGQ